MYGNSRCEKLTHAAHQSAPSPSTGCNRTIRMPLDERPRRDAAAVATLKYQEQLHTLKRGERQDQVAAERESHQRTPATNPLATTLPQSTLPPMHELPPDVEITEIEGAPGEPSVTFRASRRHPVQPHPPSSTDETLIMLPPTSIKAIVQTPNQPPCTHTPPHANDHP